MQASAPKVEDQGLAAGILVSFRLFGALTGLAISATTFSSVFQNSLSRIGPLPASAALLTDPNEVVSFIATLRDADIPPELLDQIRDAYRLAMQSIFFILAGFSGLGFVTSLFLEQLEIDTEEVGRQHFHAEEAGQAQPEP
jgi:hypothetical protein